ncbi:hypothetical protein TREES_T100000941 [Tupaia chinensis]|uniref:Uncharacterized protein n=1 Tax=Tupaia chinensis TaxID=246437 RepID=L9JGN0_TUPCH|nr:hypothetical protein TREES_T100000941 [Tupaia chinensis]
MLNADLRNTQPGAPRPAPAQPQDMKTLLARVTQPQLKRAGPAHVLPTAVETSEESALVELCTQHLRALPFAILSLAASARTTQRAGNQQLKTYVLNGRMNALQKSVFSALLRSTRTRQV